MLVAGITFFLLRILGLHRPQLSDVVLSHPAIHPEVYVIGRPGVRLPYVRYLGLHYQIMRDRIVLTFMPGRQWDIPNPQIINVLNQSLKDIQRLLVPEPGRRIAQERSIP